METMFTQQDQWLKDRMGKITASEIGKLMVGGKSKGDLFGEGAQTYINEKIAEIMTMEAKSDISGLKALEWGAAHEMDAVMAFTEQTGIDLEYFGVAEPKFFKYNAYSGGSPDGLSATHVAEVKCPFVTANHVNVLRAMKSGVNHNEWLKKNKKEHYAQVQFNMKCTERKQGYYISYDERTLDYSHRLAVLEIKYDEPFLDELIMRLEAAGKIINDALIDIDKPSLSSTIIASPIPEGIMVQQA